MTLTLTSKEHLTDNIWSFHLKPSEPLTWIAGQFIRVELPHPNPDQEGAKRWFTVSSAPYEEQVQITTRVTNSTFKQALAAVPEGGTLVLLEKPDGDFIWQDSDQPIVFIAGGIGVTPFHSILKQRAHEGQPLAVTLLYGNRSDAIPFKDELNQWAAQDQRLKVEYMVSTPLTPESLAARAPQLLSSLVYLSGPEPMVESIGYQLRAAGLPEAQLKQDFFPNYNETNY